MLIIRGVVLIACILLAGCEWFPESVFMLSTESRLPRWFQQPADVSRGDLSVKMLYYIDHATFVLRNERTGRQLAKTRAQILNDKPLYLAKSLRADGTIPSYSIVKVDNIVEIVEHSRLEHGRPVIDISDDSDLRTKLLSMTGNEALLK